MLHGKARRLRRKRDDWATSDDGGVTLGLGTVNLVLAEGGTASLNRRYAVRDAIWGSDSNGAKAHAKRRFPDSLGVGDLALYPRSRIGTYRRD